MHNIRMEFTQDGVVFCGHDADRDDEEIDLAYMQFLSGELRLRDSLLTEIQIESIREAAKEVWKSVIYQAPIEREILVPPFQNEDAIH